MSSLSITQGNTKKKKKKSRKQNLRNLNEALDSPGSTPVSKLHSVFYRELKQPVNTNLC